MDRPCVFSSRLPGFRRDASSAHRQRSSSSAHLHINWSGKLIDIAVMVVDHACARGVAACLNVMDFGFTLTSGAGHACRGLLLVALPFPAHHCRCSRRLCSACTKLPSSSKLWPIRSDSAGPRPKNSSGAAFCLRFSIGCSARRATILGAALGLWRDREPRSSSVSFIPCSSIQSSCCTRHSIDGAFAAVTGLVLVWIRARSKSLVFPVLVHNATNLILESVPLMA